MEWFRDEWLDVEASPSWLSASPLVTLPRVFSYGAHALGMSGGAPARLREARVSFFCAAALKSRALAERLHVCSHLASGGDRAVA